MNDGEETPIIPNPVGDGESDAAQLQSVSETAGSRSSIIPVASAEEIERLPPEMKTMVSMMAGIVRSPSGPDPETAHAIAQAEMHEETCRLEAYKEMLKTRDRKDERDDGFRRKRLNHETAKSGAIIAVCVGGVIVGLYLLAAKGQSTLGTGVLVASIMGLMQILKDGHLKSE